MSLRHSALILVLASVVTATEARADQTSPFVMTDPSNFDLATGFEFAVGQIDRAGLGTTVAGLQGWIHWPVGDRWTFSGRLPIIYATNDTNDGGTLGNLTFDGTFFINARKRRRAVRMSGLNISVSAPTAGDRGDGAFASGTWTDYFSINPGLYAPGATTIRLHGLWRTEGYRYFGQVEFGVHQMINRNADDNTLLRAGVAVGFKISRALVLIGELTNMSDVLDESRGGEDFWHTLDLGIRANTGRAGVLGLRAYLPLDRSMRNRGAFGLMLGYEVYL